MIRHVKTTYNRNVRELQHISGEPATVGWPLLF